MRDTKKLEETDNAGIEHLQLDVLSSDSIASCVQSLEALTGRLDLLVNNAGAGYPMPAMDVDITEAHKIFDLNVFSLITVTRAFLPLLLKSPDAKVANNISLAAYLTLPVCAMYHSSKAAANSLTDTMRLELAPFGVKVVALITGSVQTNFFSNLLSNSTDAPQLPQDSIYRVVPGGLKMMTNSGDLLTSKNDMDAQTWATQVVSDLLKANPAHQIWRGSSATMARIASHMPVGMLDSMAYKVTKFDEVGKALKEKK